MAPGAGTTSGKTSTRLHRRAAPENGPGMKYMDHSNKKMIGGAAIHLLGSSRHSKLTGYLIDDPTTEAAHIHDEANKAYYLNANGNAFYAAVWDMEKENPGPIATPIALLELKAYSYAQNCRAGLWQQADNDWFDMRFLRRAFGIPLPVLVRDHISVEEYGDILKEVNGLDRFLGG